MCVWWVLWQGEVAMRRARDMKSLLGKGKEGKEVGGGDAARDRAERAFAAWMVFVERKRAG